MPGVGQGSHAGGADMGMNGQFQPTPALTRPQRSCSHHQPVAQIEAEGALGLQREHRRCVGAQEPYASKHLGVFRKARATRAADSPAKMNSATDGESKAYDALATYVAR